MISETEVRVIVAQLPKIRGEDKRRDYIKDRLLAAFQAGREDKASEIRAALGLDDCVGEKWR